MSQRRGAALDLQSNPVEDPAPRFLLQNLDIADVIKGAYSLCSEKIHEPDHEGYTPVYVAAMSEILLALRTLLVLGVTDDLKNVTNESKATPLDLLKDIMLLSRDFIDNTLNVWMGTRLTP